MKKKNSFNCQILNLTLLLCFLCGSAFSQSSLKIMTYNIQGMKPGTDANTRTLQIIEKLKEIDPDIIGFQEINETLGGSNNQLKTIADSLTVYFNRDYFIYFSVTHLSWDNQFRESIGILSKYPVIEEGYKQLPNGVFPRKVVWNYIDTPLGKINFFNTHLSFNSSSVRIQQVQSIIPYVLEKETNNIGIALILTGDFNDIPNTTTITQLTNSVTDTFYIDTYKKTNPASNGFTVSSLSPNSRIDYVFLKNTSSLIIDTSYIVMNEPYLVSGRKSPRPYE